MDNSSYPICHCTPGKTFTHLFQGCIVKNTIDALGSYLSSHKICFKGIRYMTSYALATTQRHCQNVDTYVSVLPSI